MAVAYCRFPSHTAMSHSCARAEHMCGHTNAENHHGMCVEWSAPCFCAGQLLKLNGAGAYQAAVHCATISAAKRLRGWSRQRRTVAPAAPVADAEALSQLESPSTPPRHMPNAHPCWD